MKFWSESSGNSNRCCSSEAERRARAVARKLGIRFYVFNFEKEFKKRIVDYFLKEYKSGLTPNPCVVCNKEIKFGLLLEKALAIGADCIATGHYARILKLKTKNLKVKNSAKNSKNIYKLFKGKDSEKDQSYFLWRLNQKQLSRVIFPVGDYKKSEVKKLAEKFGLPISLDNYKESQEICFVPKDVNTFLKKHLKTKAGKIVDSNGEVLGNHQGLALYTIGQRKGINLPAGPYYVAEKNLKKNLLIVTKNEKDLYKKEILLKEINWISGKEPKLLLRVEAKIRYRHNPEPAIIKKYKKYSLIFDSPQKAITPGQSAVFYRREELIGGGTIA